MGHYDTVYLLGDCRVDITSDGNYFIATAVVDDDSAYLKTSAEISE